MNNFFLGSIVVGSLLVYIIIYILILCINHPITIFIKKYIFSDIPIFQISDDDNFHTVENYSDNKTYRYSFLFLPVGEHKLYFFTYNKGTFSWYYRLSLGDIFLEKQRNQSNSMDSEVANGILKYNQAVNNQDYHDEILKNNIEIFKNSSETAKLKGSIYFAVCVGIIALYSDNIETFSGLIKNSNLIIFTLTIFTLILFLNFFLFVIQYHSVKNKNAQFYQDYLNSSYSNKEAYFEYFFRSLKWSCLDSIQETTYIRNIELYIKKYLLFIILLLCIQVIYQNDNIKGDENETTISCKLRD